MLKRLGKMLAGLTHRAIPLSTLRQSGIYGPTGAGVTVNETTALRFSAVFASIRVIAETRGSLPIHVFERKKSGKRALVSQHPVSIALSTQPNDDMTPMVWSRSLSGANMIVSDSRSVPGTCTERGSLSMVVRLFARRIVAAQSAMRHRH